DYDPMLAKVIATGADRDQALSRLDRALGSTVVHGLSTNTSYLQQLVTDPQVRAGQMDTTMIERKLPALQFPRPQQHHAAAAALFLAQRRGLIPGDTAPAQRPGTWRRDGWRPGTAHTDSFIVRCSPAGAAPEEFEVPLDGSAELRADPGHGRWVLTAEHRSI